MTARKSPEEILAWKQRLSERMKGNSFAKGHAPSTTSFKKGHSTWNKGKAHTGVAFWSHKGEPWNSGLQGVYTLTEHHKKNISKGAREYLAASPLRVKQLTNRLRKKHADTSIERAVEKMLREAQIPYEKQWRFSYTLEGSPATGLADFKLQEAPVVIECDGDYWHNLPKVQRKDRAKELSLAEQGVTVLRFSGTQIASSPETVRVKLFLYSGEGTETL